jgi:hypothetical protein
MDRLLPPELTLGLLVRSALILGLALLLERLARQRGAAGGIPT